MFVNITGSFIIGFCAGLIVGEKFQFSLNLQKFVMVGICGGYTTFSSFSLDSLKLIQKGQFLEASANILSSVIFSLIAVYFGYILAFSLRKISF